MGFGMGSSAIARGPGADALHFTVIPLPVQPSTDVTLQRRADAFAITYSGRLEEAVDIYRLSVEADGWMCGILDTMAHGLLGLPLSFQGAPEMVSALLDADGTPGDFAAMHPENECAKIFRDGVGCGFGLGQYLLMCWRCQSTEWERGATDAHVESCKCCGATELQRPLGSRRLYQLRWRDSRWLWRNPITLQWFYNGRGAMVAITPGDGEWFLFQTVPDIDVWRHGPWVWGTAAAIFARDSTYDRQNTSAVCAPTHVFKATGPTGKGTREDVESQAAGLAFGNKLVLPGEWDHRIDAATADFVDVTAAIVEWAASMWEVGITGNIHGVKAGTGFANMDVYARATRERRAFYAGAWIRQIGAQGLVWWGRDNFGTTNVPVGKYDVRSPEDKLSESKALEAEGAALKALREGLDAHGAEIVPVWLVERAQAKGIRVQLKAAGGTPVAKLELGVDAIAAVVLGIEGRAAQGLAPFGDERDQKTIADLMGDIAPAPGAKPLTAMPNTPPGGSAPAAQLDARAAVPEDDDEDDDEGDAARLAAQMNEHGFAACRHGRTARCDRCGVRASYAATVAEDGTKAFAPTWRAIAKAAPAQVAA